MRARRQPRLQPGRVYSTAELAAWSKNPSRLARRLELQGKLERVGRGLFACPRRSRFGPAPPREEELLRAFLKGTPFVITGPERWNTLGLGSTALFAAPLVYNTKRSGELTLGGMRFILRRVRFPRKPTPEWFAVDLVGHHAMAGVALSVLETRLAAALAEGRLSAGGLLSAARRYGTKKTGALVARALRTAFTTQGRRVRQQRRNSTLPPPSAIMWRHEHTHP